MAEFCKKESSTAASSLAIAARVGSRAKLCYTDLVFVYALAVQKFVSHQMLRVSMTKVGVDAGHVVVEEVEVKVAGI